MTAPSSPALGTTTDPTALVPGRPGDLRTLTAELRTTATELSGTGEHLRTLRAPSWTGTAADAFWDSFDQVTKSWLTAADRLDSTAALVEGHAGVLDSAQARAQEAIDRWAEAERLTAQSQAAYDTAVRTFEQSPLGGPMMAPVLVDGGAGERQAAEDILETARADVEASGQETLLGLVRIGGGTLTQGFADWFGVDGGHAWVGFAEGALTHPFGPGAFVASGSASVLDASVDKVFEISGSEGLKIGGEAAANVVAAEGEVGYEDSWWHVSGGANGQVGLSGEGSIVAGTEGVGVGGEVFAGARAGAEAEASVAGVGVGAGAEAWAGAGATAEAGVTQAADGSWHVGAKVGAAWGVGGSVSVDVVIDPDEMGAAVDAVADAMTGWW